MLRFGRPIYSSWVSEFLKPILLCTRPLKQTSMRYIQYISLLEKEKGSRTCNEQINSNVVVNSNGIAFRIIK